MKRQADSEERNKQNRRVVVVVSSNNQSQQHQQQQRNPQIDHHQEIHYCKYVLPFEYIPQNVLDNCRTNIDRVVAGKDPPFLLSTKNLGLCCAHDHSRSDRKPEPEAVNWSYYIRYVDKDGEPVLPIIQGEPLVRIFSDAIIKYLDQNPPEVGASMVLYLSKTYSTIPIIPIGLQTTSSYKDPYLKQDLECNHPNEMPILPIKEAPDILRRVCYHYGIDTISATEREELCHLLKNNISPPLQMLAATAVSTASASSSSGKRRKNY